MLSNISTLIKENPQMAKMNKEKVLDFLEDVPMKPGWEQMPDQALDEIFDFAADAIVQWQEKHGWN